MDNFGFISGIYYSGPPRTNYGLFTQTASSTPVVNTTSELTLIDGGIGTLSVPPNQFVIGDTFKLSMFGHISSDNNRTLRIRVKANAVVLGDTGLITMPQTTNQHWGLEVMFTIRATGAAGVASIVTAGQFTYTKDASNAFEGENFVTVENTNFNTLIANTLNITAQWGTASVNNSIYSDSFVLYKVF